MNRDELEAEALIGDEAKRFMDSDLGRTMLGLAKQKVELAVAEFADADTTDQKTIIRLQSQIALGQQFEDWLIDLFNSGEEALKVLQTNGTQE